MLRLSPTLSVLLSVSLLIPLLAQDPTPKRPNIILVMTDDQGRDSIFHLTRLRLPGGSVERVRT